MPPLAEPEAVSLFCERSQLEPSEEIAELCARLDKLPLAVELAAARTKALSPAQILERLSGGLDLLKGGRDADPRQQTLRATIEWSYELLSPEEQQLFARLAVFAGGCTLEAAEEVADADLDTLQSLVEKSLLRFTDERYWMLETIREYAAERLEEAGECEQTRDGHVQFMADETRSSTGTHPSSWASAAEALAPTREPASGVAVGSRRRYARGHRSSSRTPSRSVCVPRAVGGGVAMAGHRTRAAGGGFTGPRHGGAGGAASSPARRATSTRDRAGTLLVARSGRLACGRTLASSMPASRRPRSSGETPARARAFAERERRGSGEPRMLGYRAIPHSVTAIRDTLEDALPRE